MIFIAKENVHGLKATLLRYVTTVCFFVNFNLPYMPAFCDIRIIHDVVWCFFTQRLSLYFYCHNQFFKLVMCS